MEYDGGNPPCELRRGCSRCRRDTHPAATPRYRPLGPGLGGRTDCGGRARRRSFPLRAGSPPHDAVATVAGQARFRASPRRAGTRAAAVRDLPGRTAPERRVGGHIPDVNPDASCQPAPGVYGEAAFTTTPGSVINDLLGDTAESPCYHHQAMDSVPETLRVTARSADGMVQALEATAGGWVLGVQFHPEQNPDDLRLFRGFVEAAANYHSDHASTMKAMSPA